MQVIRVVFDIDGPFSVSNRGTDLVVQKPCGAMFVVNLVTDEFSIKIRDWLYLVREIKPHNIGQDAPLPLRFLAFLQSGQLERAKQLLDFDVENDVLQRWFGQFEIVRENFLGCPRTFSIVNKGSRECRNLVFQIKDGKISNID